MESLINTTGQQSISLRDIDQGSTYGMTKQQADRRLAELHKEVRELHDLMMAAETHSLLVILQGMDASGKDVTIENVFSAMNPSAARVKEPAGEEAKHPFLWRADAATPMYGEAVIFDRSYYEQVILPRVHGGLEDRDIRLREDHIQAFERTITESGTILVKIFLHVSKDVQEQRLEERQNDIRSAWKISASDWSDREHWEDYMDAYEKTLHNCTSDTCPWNVVPADNSWFHNVAVAQLLVDRLMPFRPVWEEARKATAS